METQLKKLPEGLRLMKGAHNSPDSGMCVMEAVAFVAGERHSDSPECASPMIASFLRAWNDSVSDEKRQELLPYVERLVNSRGAVAEVRLRAARKNARGEVRSDVGSCWGAEAEADGEEGQEGEALMGRFLCWPGWHRLPPGITRRWSIYWCCARCGERQRGEMGADR